MLEQIDIDALPLSQALLVFLADPLVLLCIAIDLLILIHLRRNPPGWAIRAEQLNSRPWSSREAEAIILAAVTFILAVRTVIAALFEIGAIKESDIEVSLVAGQTMLFHTPAILLILVLMARNRTLTQGLLSYRLCDIRSAFWRGTIFCMASFPVVGIAGIIQNHFLSAAGYTNEPQYVIELFNSPAPLIMKLYLVLVTVVTAPLAEEFIFRGIGITALTDKVGIKWSVLIVSAAFALIHFNLYSFIPLFTLALAFSLAYIYTGSLLVTVFMHAVFNAINILSLLLSGQGS